MNKLLKAFLYLLLAPLLAVTQHVWAQSDTTVDPIAQAVAAEDLRTKKLANDKAERELKWGSQTYTPPTGDVTVTGKDTEATGFSVLAYYEAMDAVAAEIAKSLRTPIKRGQVVLFVPENYTLDLAWPELLTATIRNYDSSLRSMLGEAQDKCKLPADSTTEAPQAEMGVASAFLALQALGTASSFFSSTVEIGTRSITEGQDAVSVLVASKLGERKVFFSDKLYLNLWDRMQPYVDFLNSVSEIAADLDAIQVACRQLAKNPTNKPVKDTFLAIADVLKKQIDAWKDFHTGLLLKQGTAHSALERAAFAAWLSENVDFLLNVKALGGHADHIIRKTFLTKGTLVASGQIGVSYHLTNLRQAGQSQFKAGSVVSFACYRGVKVKDLSKSEKNPLGSSAKCLQINRP